MNFKIFASYNLVSVSQKTSTTYMFAINKYEDVIHCTKVKYVCQASEKPRN